MERTHARVAQPPCVGLLGGRGEPHNAVRMGYVGDDEGAGDATLVVLGVKEAPEGRRAQTQRQRGDPSAAEARRRTEPAENMRAPRLLKARHEEDHAQGNRAIVANEGETSTDGALLGSRVARTTWLGEKRGVELRWRRDRR